MEKIGFGEIEEVINKFIDKNKEILDKIDVVIGMSRGGLVPATLVAAKIDKPLIAAYIDRQDEIYFDRVDWIAGKNILVIDDIIRSGKTLWLLNEYLAKNAKPREISFFTLFKVVSLMNKNYNLLSFSREINEDVIFPWDYDRK
jgi:hypoxanthine phosphoribosyltransferase